MRNVLRYRWMILRGSKGNTGRHIKQTCSEITRIIKRCRFIFWSDISPSKVQQCLADLRNSKKPISIRTSNHHLRAFKQFCKWMVDEGRAHESPVKCLKQMNTQEDLRHKRRALTEIELMRLLDAASKGPVVHGMAGRDREMLYRLAMETGLRWSELHSLKKSSFSLDSNPPTVQVDGVQQAPKRGYPPSSQGAGSSSQGISRATPSFHICLSDVEGQGG